MAEYMNATLWRKIKSSSNLGEFSKSLSHDLLRCQRGNMSLMAAGALAVILLALGTALDTSMSTSTKAQAQATLDAAILASAVDRTERINSVVVSNSLGEQHFTDYFDPPKSDTTISSVDVTFDPSTNETIGIAHVKYQTILMGMFGRPEMDIRVTSTAVGGAERPIDVGLMLDVSGSMDGERLDGLKSAVDSFLDIVIGAGQNSDTTRVALVPFSTSVNAGPYATLLTQGHSPEGCVGDRSGPDAFTDDFGREVNAFNVNGEFGISKDGNSGEYREGYFNNYPPSPGLVEFDVSTICSESEIFPLTGNYDLLKAKLNSYEAVGLTAGHLGIAYAWYTISEKWRRVWPNDRQPGLDNETDKVVILMTDGEFNTYYETSNGLPNVQGQQLCDNMKANNVTIYAISFDNEGDSTDLLSDCASESEYFFDTDTISGLTEVFENIAGQLKGSDVYLSR